MSQKSTPTQTQSQGSLRSSPYPARRRSPRFEHTASSDQLDQHETSSLNPHPPNQTHDSLFQFTADCRLKKTTGQRLDSGDKLGLHLITLNDWDSIKRRLWEICLPSLQPLATYSGDPPAWNMSTKLPTIEHFNKYIALRIETSGGARNLPVWQTIHDAHKALAKLRGRTITISAYKWAKLVLNHPDRAGAASEAEHKEILSQLKSVWSSLTAPEMAWRIWANEICLLPEGQRARAILKGPMSSIISMFSTTSSSAREHMSRLKRNCRLALDLVDGAIYQFDAIRRTDSRQREILDSRLDGFEAMLRSKKEIILSYADDLDPRPDDMAVLRVLGAIPSQEDE
ncbi:hypothetical protein Ae201684_002908 [Aphanomyces euteiches]|uniref:Uncharacterized protein n=1 Tax=Aphanomyces euteiches TaxID=100861 RepID=A0A6G0XNX3_9STRA|nr:hypothetical protein Ae201684_002908 [Aphanomyces euteiches]